MRLKLHLDRPARKLLFGAGLLLSALAAALAVCEFIGWPFLRGPVEQRLSGALARPLVIAEPFSMRLFGSVRLQAGAMTIAGPADGRPWADREVLHARQIRIDLPWSTLARVARGDVLRPLIRELTVRELTLDFERESQHRSNWPLGPMSTPDGVHDRAPAATLEDRLPRFERLHVHGATLRLVDAPSRLRVDATLRTSEGRLADSGAGLTLRAEGSYRELPLHLLFESSGLLPLIGDGAAAVPATLDGRLGRTRLQLNGSVSDVFALHALRGEFVLSGPSLAAVGDALGITLPTTAPFEMKGAVVKDATVWQARVARLAIGSSRLNGQFRFDTAPRMPLLSGSLGGERMALRDLGPALGAPTEASPAASVAQGRVLPRREFDIPSLRAMNADVQLDLARVEFGTPALAPLAPLRGHVLLKDGLLTIEQLVARTADGQLRGQFRLDARTALPRWSADLRVSEVLLERFITVTNPRDRTARQVPPPAPASPPASPPTSPPASAPAHATGAKPAYISGRLNGHTQLSGEGRSTAAMLASLDGKLRLWVRQGQLSHLLVEAAGIDVAEGLALLLRGDKPLPLRCAVAQFAVKDGTLRPDLALIDTDDSTLLVEGQLSLADESLALVVRTQPHDFSPLTLRAPVRIEGSFAKPIVRLDARRLGLTLGAAAALAALVSPLAALLPLIDFGEEDRRLCGGVAAGRPTREAR